MHACKKEKMKPQKKKIYIYINYLPRKIFSAKIKEPMIATMIIIKGLKAVANTGPLFFITSPCT